MQRRRGAARGKAAAARWQWVPLLTSPGRASCPTISSTGLACPPAAARREFNSHAVGNDRAGIRSVSRSLAVLTVVKIWLQEGLPGAPPPRCCCRL